MGVIRPQNKKKSTPLILKILCLCLICPLAAERIPRYYGANDRSADSALENDIRCAPILFRGRFPVLGRVEDADIYDEMSSS